MDFKVQYTRWLKEEKLDAHLKHELINLKDEKEIEDRFYKNLEFGTGGLRGKLAAGNNRMNIYTVGKATQGIANYIKTIKENPVIVIAYDSRNMSKTFALRAASVLAANKIKVYLFKELKPTPMLSFAVRHLKADIGIVITASHNPKEYNGYKVYGEDGGQITNKVALELTDHINQIDIFEDVQAMCIEDMEKQGMLEYISHDVEQVYYEKVKALIMNKELVKKRANELSIIYTPIHGSGNIPVRTILKQLGFINLVVVKEQELPDGDFPTVPYPNPEDKAVFKAAIALAKETTADLIFGTDPDCDRIGVVARNEEGGYEVLTGNQIGCLLTEYILNTKYKLGEINEKATVIKTIVTSDLTKAICKHYGVQLIEVLTGFKYIGEKVKEFEESQTHQFVFGFEESYGYLSGEFVRDKDAIIAAALIAEMTLYYKEQGKDLNEALTEIYEKYGYYKEELITVEMEGRDGQKKIQEILDKLRRNRPKQIGRDNVVQIEDFKCSNRYNTLTGEVESIKLPTSNVIKLILQGDSWVVVRPSGTEPKMKIYLSAIGNSRDNVQTKLETLKKEILNYINK